MNLSMIAPMFQGSNSTALLYIPIVIIALLITFFVVKKWRDDVRSYLAVEAIYGTIAGGFAIWLAKDLFHIMQLLAYGLFLGGVIFLLICGLFARKKFKVLSSLYLILAVTLAGIGIDAFFLEPHDLQIDHFEVKTTKLDKPIKIAVVADLQTDIVGDYEKSVLMRIMDEKPDLIVFPGDYIQVFTQQEFFDQSTKLNQMLRAINFSAPLGVYAVPGNVDSIQYGRIFDGVKGKAFTKLETVESGPFAITGLLLDDSFNRSVKILPQKKFHIVVGHAPDFALANPDADLLLAGHTHGGQVALPGIGPLLTFSAVPRTWAKGGLNYIDKDTALVVTRGIGMERNHAPRLRFLCKPQLVFVTVVPTN